MPRYGTRYLEIEAIQYTGDNGQEVADFTKVTKDRYVWWAIFAGYYIIKSPDGLFYVMPEDVFNEKYVQLNDRPGEHRLIVEGDVATSEEQS